jgi:hypothetical protein
MHNDLSDNQSRFRFPCTVGILDTPAEERFDQFTLLAIAAFNVPIALVSLMNQGRHWCKSRQGLTASQTHRPLAFCCHAIESEEMLIVADAQQDPRFSDDPLVAGGTSTADIGQHRHRIGRRGSDGRFARSRSGRHALFIEAQGQEPIQCNRPGREAGATA